MKSTSHKTLTRKIFILSLAMSTLVGTGGCITAAMWDNTDTTRTVQEKKMVTNDKVIAFGQAQADSQQLDKGSLVMMGEKFWYALPSDVSEKFVGILKTGLPRAYTITTPKQNNSDTINHVNVLPIEISDNVGKFSSDFCLNYTLDSNNNIAKQEIPKLTGAGFVEVDSIKHNYQKCIHTEGKYFTAINDKVSAEYRFKNPIDVSMYSYESKEKTNIGKTVTSVVATPFTLVADTAMVVVLIPVLVFGGLTGGM